jgi:hypothetical protein
MMLINRFRTALKKRENLLLRNLLSACHYRAPLQRPYGLSNDDLQEPPIEVLSGATPSRQTDEKRLDARAQHLGRPLR